MRYFLCTLLAGTVATIGAARAKAVNTAQYAVTLLNFTAEGINNSGQVTGYNPSIIPTPNNCCVWTPGPGGGTLINLPTTTDEIREGLAINNVGQVSGLGGVGITPLWTPTSGGYSLTNIGDVNSQGSEDIWASGINDSGVVVGAGWDFFGGGGWTNFLWKPTVPNGTAGTMVPLGKLAGTTAPMNTVNNVGQVALSGNHAVLWNPATPNGTTGTMYDLGSLSGPTGTSVSKDINSKGQIVGTSTVGSTSHAFVWTPSTPNGVTGSMIDLGDLPGDQSGSKALAINSAGTVVGKSGEGMNSSSINGNAVIWTADAGPLNLNNLVESSGSAWRLTEATGINDQGWIIGQGLYDPDGPGGAPAVFSSFLLTPVPEPTSLSVMLGGAAALCIRKKKRHDQ
jgi:probable HAF family extracellular repeat protein